MDERDAVTWLLWTPAGLIDPEMVEGEDVRLASDAPALRRLIVLTAPDVEETDAA